MKNDFVEYKAKDRLAEAVALAKAINLEVVLEEIVILSKISSASFIGSGKVNEYANIIKQLGVTLVIIDEKIFPIQQRNLEKSWKCKVIERTALIDQLTPLVRHFDDGKEWLKNLPDWIKCMYVL